MSECAHNLCTWLFSHFLSKFDDLFWIHFIFIQTVMCVSLTALLESAKWLHVRVQPCLVWFYMNLYECLWIFYEFLLFIGLNLGLDCRSHYIFLSSFYTFSASSPSNSPYSLSSSSDNIPPSFPLSFPFSLLFLCHTSLSSAGTSRRTARMDNAEAT